jgi:hypothetical protein
MSEEQRVEDSPYRRAVMDLLVDNTLCEDDLTALDRYRAHLGLSSEEAAQIRLDAGWAELQHRVNVVLRDGTVSPEEAADIEQLEDWLGMTVTDRGQAALDRARRLWDLTAGPLPSVPVDIGLLRGETAHAVVRAVAYESRAQSVGFRYAGASLSVPIIKGVRFRLGQVAYDRQHVRFDHRLGDGDLIVTNVRLIFCGPERAITSQLTSVLDIDAYSNAVVVQRTAGKPVTYTFDAPDPDFPVILARAWKGARA